MQVAVTSAAGEFSPGECDHRRASLKTATIWVKVVTSQSGVAIKQLLTLLFFLPAAVAAVAADPFAVTVQPFLRRNCSACHSDRLASGEVSFAKYLAAGAREGSALKDRERWELVEQKLRAGEMPPKGTPRPSAEQISAITKWIDSSYARIDRDTPPDPGRVTAHRLNRYEYNHAIRDLLGVELGASEDFPIDPYGYGFDNIGDVLSLSPVHTEKYLQAAEHVASVAIPAPGAMKPIMVRYLAERMGQSRELHISVAHEFPVDGEYTLRSAWFQGLRPGTSLTGRLFLDGRELKVFPIAIHEEIDLGFEIHDLAVTAGVHKVEADIRCEGYQKDPPFLEYIQVYGPSKQTPASQSSAYRRIFSCADRTPECARQIVERLAHRAYRRPVSAGEVDQLRALVAMAQNRGDSFESGIRLALEAMLVNPNFLFRIEHDAEGAAAVHRISDVELASRLSFFLWSSIPDEELLRLAEAGKLHHPAVLLAQMKRLLSDSRSRSLTENFAGQWLQFRNLDVLKPDPRKFPEYGAGLREAMRTETEMFFAAVVREDRSILDFLDGKFTFLNGRLAKHYGIRGVTGPEFRRVELDGTERSGVLTQASVLTVSSYPTRTSPVIRGKWVLENLLDTPPPPPPPDVPPLSEAGVGTSFSLREQLEKHRSNAVCAGCHARMDPIGFGLENYDAIGRYRKVDGKFPIDPSGTLPNGKSFAGAAEFKTILRNDPRTFTHALSGKLLTYALGRGLETYDRAAVARIVASVERNDYRFSSLIQAIVESAPFQMRRTAPRIEESKR